jgi:cystathionine beta-lyase/cystathionine gamma-synthase
MLLLLLRSKLNGTHVFFARKMFEKLATTFLKRGERERERASQQKIESTQLIWLEFMGSPFTFNFIIILINLYDFNIQ